MGRQRRFRGYVSTVGGSMGWLGLDDTDSLAGGCTTAVFHDLLNGLPDSTSIGTPRLVRLWPFAQRRTRGNAALGIELQTEDVGELIRHLDAWWSNHIAPFAGEVAPSDVSPREQSPASPGMVWFENQPPSEFYQKAVRTEVTLDELPTPERSWGGHGRIGATAAVSWKGKECTWEAIAWRLEGADSARRVDHATVEAVDGWPEIVFSRDPRRGTSLIAPRGRSPVLFGLRATSKEAAEKGCRLLVQSEETERVRGWRVFQTNQASGDHLGDHWLLKVQDVLTDPVRKHAQITTNGPDVLCYAEGGPVNALARWLQEGDVIEVAGLIDHDEQIHAERLKLKSWVPRSRQRPLCPDCQVRMKSMGAGQGIRCPKCKRREGDEWIDIPGSPPFRTWVEPPLDARRHLSRPLEWEDMVGSGEILPNDEEQSTS